MLWIKDPVKWQAATLKEKVEALRKYYCTGPCGQDHTTLSTRTETNNVLKEVISKL